MPEFSEIISTALAGAIDAIETSEQAHLLNQVTAVEKLNGKTPGVADVKSLYEEGWLPDYFAASALTLDAQLSMATTRERTIGGQADVAVGPLKLTGSLSTSLKQATNTNVAVSITLERQSRNQGLTNAFESLTQQPIPPLPSQVAQP